MVKEGVMSPDEAQSPDAVWFSAENLVGRVIQQRYQLQRVIGSGGSCVLFAATDMLSGNPVALKVHRSCEPNGMGTPSRFKREADVGTALGVHPNIVKLLAWDHHLGKIPFLVFELL